MTEIYIGIDVSKDTLDIAAYPSAQIWQYKNGPKGIAKTAAKLKALGVKLIVMEATGGLEKPLASGLHEAGLPVAVVNPRCIRDHARALGILAKTDKLDAGVIAHFAAKMEPTPRPTLDKPAEEMANLLTRRSQLLDMLTAERNRLKPYLESSVLKDIKEHISWLEAKLEGLDKEIKEKMRQSPSFKERSKLYESVPGVGRILSASLISKLPELGRLNQREIATLVGVAPLNKDSGKMRGRRMIQGGRAMLRKALYMPTLVATRCNPVIRDFYLRLLARGKLKKVAIVACMHKMIIILNAMAKNNTPWRCTAA